MNDTTPDPHVIVQMARTMDELHRVPILVLPNDDERFEDLVPGHVVSDGKRFYVPESLWPALRAELLKLRPGSRLRPRTPVAITPPQPPKGNQP